MIVSISRFDVVDVCIILYRFLIILSDDRYFYMNGIV